MKKKFLSCILISVLAIQLWGCGEPDAETTGDSSAAGKEDFGISAESGPSGGEVFGSEGGDLFLSLTDMPWRDNSLDVYSAVINAPLRDTHQEGAMEGGAFAYILGSTSGSVFKKHLFVEAADRWDEVKTVTDQGVETSFRLAFWEGKTNQAWMAGGIAGSDHYMMMVTEAVENNDADRNRLYRFFETDEDMQILNSFYVDCLDGVDLELPDQIMVDASGNIHMITFKSSDGTSYYYIVSPDGTLLAEGSSAGGDYEDSKLVSLYDRRVGLLSGKKIMYLDAGTGETSVLADISSSYRFCTLWDEKTLLYADGKGLYRSDLSGGNPEILYTWSNHGIAAASIEGIQVSEDQCISLIYQDSMGANYLKLKPTAEEVEIQEITFAVSLYRSDKYQSAVAEFNKRYPACHIQVKTYDYSDSSLLTEMTAGRDRC